MANLNRVTTRRSFENMIMSYRSVKWKISTRRVNRKEIDVYSVDDFCGHCNTVLEAMDCYYQYCPRQESRPSVTEEEIQRGNKNRELDEVRKQYIQEKGYNVIDMYECGWL